MTESSVGEHCSIEIIDEEEYMTKEANGSNQTSIGNRDEKAIVCSIEGKLCTKSPLPSVCCIFRVPDILRRPNKKVFVPELISIGPFHHGKEELQEMEKIKLWYLHCLLDRAPTPETSLECFVKAIGNIEQYCRECYAEEIRFSGEKFLEMMVVDGCFIIEFFRKDAGVVPRDKDDPVFNTSWISLQIGIELLLLENQLPWRVLNCLFEMTYGKEEATSLAMLASFSFCGLVPYMYLYPNNNLENRHLLDFLRNCLFGSYAGIDAPERVTPWLDHIPSVTELLQAGVKFKKKENKDDGLLDITFNEDGVMEIPQIFIWENTETLLRNLIAFERCDMYGKNKITSYIVLLDNLINNSKDVDFLVEQNIVVLNSSLNAEDTASFFNRLSDNTGFTHFLYMDLCHQVNKHYKVRWNRWRAILKRDYFNNPWSIVSFIAAIIILLLTFLQTLYSILSYKY